MERHSTISNHRIVYLDAFTDKPFQGNPCAVLPEADGLDEAQMQLIAKESNQPETAFVLSSDQADFRVIYFTPQHRVPFAGHPTIATAFLLAQEGRIPAADPAVVQFQFDIGVLPVEVYCDAKGKPSRVVMNQPQPVFGKEVGSGELLSCFNLQRQDLLPGVSAQVVSTGVPFLIVPVRNLEVLKSAEMDRPGLRVLLQTCGAAAAFLFCLEGFEADTDTHARFFNPDGTLEDPFTGSASGCMGAYVVARGLKPGPVLKIEQGHIMGRPGSGVLEITTNEKEITGVRLGGGAVRTLDGNIYIDTEEL